MIPTKYVSITILTVLTLLAATCSQKAIAQPDANAHEAILTSTERPKKATSYKIFVTSYNPEVGQTDASPCIGASGDDLCAIARNGGRSMALSQELVGHGNYEAFKYGDTVVMESDIPQCNGEFLVLDTMNERHKDRGDLFFLDRKDNTSCRATIRKK